MARPGSTEIRGVLSRAASHSRVTISPSALAISCGSRGSSSLVYAMPRPPPRSISGSSTPCSSRTAASSPTTRRAATSKAGHVEDLRADVRVDPDELETVERQRPPYGLGRLPVGERDAELLVLVRGGDELVRVRLDADGDPDLHPLPPAERLRDVRDPHDLLEGVEHDPPDTGLDGRVDLRGRLVVAVEGDAVGGHPGGQRGRQLTPGADVQIEPLLVQPPHDGTRQEGLARVEHVGVVTERGTPRPRPLPEVRLVDEVQPACRTPRRAR